MGKSDKSSSRLATLRQKAEAAVKVSRSQVKAMSPEDVQRLVYELQVYEAELEMQNEELRRTYQQLEAVRDRYANLFDFSPVGYAVLDGKGMIREANLTLCHLLGRTRKDVLKKSFENFIGHPDKEGYRVFLERLKSQGAVHSSGELTFRHVHSSPWIRLIGCHMALDDSRQGERFFQLAVEDVTELKNTKTAQGNQQALFELVLQGVNDAIVTVDEDEEVVLFNRGAERIFRCPPSHALGQPLEQFLPERFRKSHLRFIRRFSQGAIPQREMASGREVYALRADGEEFPAEITISKIEGKVSDSSRPRRLFTAVLRDITERRILQDALKKEQKFISTILDTTAALLVVIDPHGRIIRFNRGCEKATGFSREEVEGRFWWEKLLPPTDPEKVKEYFHALIQEQVPKFHENFWLTKDGNLRWITWLNELIKNEDGKVEFVIATGIDMTERRQSESRITALNTLNNTILQSTKEGIFGVDRKGIPPFSIGRLKFSPDGRRRKF